VAALAVAETIVWAGLFYVFPALISRWEIDLGWTKTEIAGAYSLALLCAAVGAPVAGRIIDAGHGRVLISICTAAGGVLISLSALIESIGAFYAIWIGIGICLAGCLYEPCFAYLTRVLGERARRAITRITLVAGFAGTVSFPLANVVATFQGWRASVLVFGVLILGVALPLFRYGTCLDSPGEPGESEGLPNAAVRTSPTGRGSLRRAMGTGTFWLLALTFSLIGLSHGIVITHLLPMLAERAVPLSVAVLAAAMIGPMQVAGRIAMMLVEQRVSMQRICSMSFVLMTGAILALTGAGAAPWLLALFVLFQAPVTE